MRNKLFFVAIAWLIMSCHQKNLVYDKPYFDFDSLVHSQISALKKIKLEIIKTTTLNGVRDSTVTIPDTNQWKHELAVFQQLDVINKPMYKGEYDVIKGKDIHSNLMVLTYRKKKSAIPSPVAEVRIYFLENIHKLRKIESSFTEKNLMYGTSRSLVLEFEDNESEPVLSHFKVKGVQKMILSDSVKLSVEGQTRYVN
ncbi:MAG: hypothetical protein JSS79_13745 [Bacteroidetes bacterium]|nr:hypothetical protein [Bacteroidota bacterium]